MKRLLLLFAVISFMGCDSDEPKTYENELFELTTGKGWRFVEEKGIDSYVGHYRKGSQKIVFDCGWYGFGNFDDISAPANAIHYEELILSDNARAKIVGCQVGQNTSWTLYVLKDEVGPDPETLTKNILHINNPSNAQEIVQIFKSHKFK